MSKARFERPSKFEQFVLGHYGELNEMQERVLSELKFYAEHNSVRFSKSALSYLFGGIGGDKAADIPISTAIGVLNTFLDEMEPHKRNSNQFEFSQAVLVRTLRGYECPRPWC